MAENSRSVTTGSACLKGVMEAFGKHLTLHSVIAAGFFLALPVYYKLNPIKVTGLIWLRPIPARFAVDQISLCGTHFMYPVACRGKDEPRPPSGYIK